MTAQRGAHYLDVAGALKPGVKLAQAQAELAAIAGRVEQGTPGEQAAHGADCAGDPGYRRSYPHSAAGIAGRRGLRSADRVRQRGEPPVGARHRAAQGDGRPGCAGRRPRPGGLANCSRKVFRWGCSGGGLGLALALASLRLLVRLIPAEVPRLNSIGLDARLLSFAFLISLAAGILFGLAPALRVSKISLTESLKESGRGSGSGGKEHSRLRDALVVSEVALAVVLLLASGLLIQSFQHLTQADPGFDRHHVLTLQLDSPAGRQDSQVPAFYRDVVAQIGALPGVRSASAVASLPLTGDNIRSSIEIEGQPTPMASRPSAAFNAIEPNYFRTLGIALVAGRDFTEHDDTKSTPVAIVNRALAQRFFPNQNPIGRHIRPGIGGYPRRAAHARDRRSDRRREARPVPEPSRSRSVCPFGPDAASDPMFIVVRTANDPQSIVDPPAAR
jgi:putative ABC transport system permease protein